MPSPPTRARRGDSGAASHAAQRVDRHGGPSAACRETTRAAWHAYLRSVRPRQATERLHAHEGTRYRKTTCRPCRAAAAKATYLHRPRRPRPRQLPAERTCTECGVTKPIDFYMRITSTKTGVYGRCRECRNARAHARYHSAPEIRAADVARAKRNGRARRLRRRLQIIPPCA